MALVQIRMTDSVFARMLTIVLLENRISAEVTHEKDARVPDGCDLIITDPTCFGKDAQRFEKAVFILRGDESAPEGRPFYRRPFLIDAFLPDVLRLLSSEEKAEESAPTLSVDKKRGVARYGKYSVSLTETEMKLLVLLYENRGQTVLSEEIVHTVFDGRPVESSNVAAVYVNYLRKKLDERFGKRFIFSVRGKGYMLKV